MSITNLHSQYEANIRRWQKYRDADRGNDAMHNRGTLYLPRPPGMEPGIKYGDQAYVQYLRRASLYGATKRTRNGLLGMAFDQEPEYIVPPRFETLLDNITGSGITYTSFIRWQCSESMLVGRYGALVDYNDKLRRPVIAGYGAEQIRNWRVAVVDGQLKLVMLLLSETVEEPGEDEWDTTYKTQFRALRLINGVYHHQIYRETSAQQEGELTERITTIGGPDIQTSHNTTEVDAGDAVRFEAFSDDMTPERFGEPLDFIPFKFFGPTLHEPDVEDSMLRELIDVEVDRYYFHRANYERALYLTTSPILVLNDPTDDYKDDELIVGASEAVRFTDAGAGVSYVEFEGRGIAAQERALETDRQDMAVHGSRLLETQSGGETATAVRDRHAGDMSPLKKLVTTSMTGHTWLTRVMAWWNDPAVIFDDPAIMVSKSTEFLVSKIAPQELQQWVVAWQAGAVSHDTVLWNISQGKGLPPDIDLEEEKAKVEVENEERAARMMEQMAMAEARSDDDDDDDDDEASN